MTPPAPCCPDVTVEAASPALIEKVRSAVTDAEGLYRLVDLRPGDYTVTFTLPGFSTFVRDGMTLPANFTATVNADMAVGALEETITVTGEAPLVDTQSTRQQTQFQRETLRVDARHRPADDAGPGDSRRNADDPAVIQRRRRQRLRPVHRTAFTARRRRSRLSTA